MKSLALLLVISALFSCRHAEPAADEICSVPAVDGKTIEVTLSGQETILRNGALGLHYFPDEAVILVRRKPSMRLLVTSAVATYLLEGGDLDHMTSAKKVLEPGGKGSFDNGYVGVSGCYRHKDGKLYAFYHAEDQEDMGTMAGGIPGYYASVGCAVSADDGTTWKKLGRVITSHKPKQWNAYAGQNDKGAGEPGVVAEKSGRFLYLYYSDHSRVDGRGVQICMARADLQKGPPVPGQWRKYHNGKFSQPGLGGRDTVIINGKKITPAGETLFPHPAYSRDLDLYIMVFNISFWTEFEGSGSLDKSGVYVSFSHDGIEWSAPYRLIKDYSVPLVGRSMSWMPNIIWDQDSSTRGRLIYGHTPRWGHEHDNSGTPHYMAGKKISLRVIE